MKCFFKGVLVGVHIVCFANNDVRYVLPKPVQKNLVREMVAAFETRNLPREIITFTTPLAAWKAAFGFVENNKQASVHVINGTWDAVCHSCNPLGANAACQSAMRTFIRTLLVGKIELLQAQERVLLAACGHVWFTPQAKL